MMLTHADLDNQLAVIIDELSSGMTSVLRTRTFRHGDSLYSIQEGLAQGYGSFEREGYSLDDYEFVPGGARFPEFQWAPDAHCQNEMIVPYLAGNHRVHIRFGDVVRVFNRYACGLLFRFLSHFKPSS